MLSGKSKGSGMVWLRRSVQTACLLLFLYLFLQTVYHPINRPGGPVALFFQLDPLVLLATWLAGAAIPVGLFLSVATLGVSVFFGRWFCGWVCPFGTLHHVLSNLRRGRLELRLNRAEYSPRQKWRYAVLIGLLVGVIGGVNLIGWLDPFSVFYRSLATAVFPALNSGLHSVFTWLYDSDPGIGSARVTAVSEPVYGVLRRYLLSEGEPQYHMGIFIGVLFVGIVAMNLWRSRFWCRYVCPLGALLGLAGKNPVLRLKKNDEACTGCRLCAAVCPGGAKPDAPSDAADGWKPAECMFCYNCQSVCPKQAISFEIAIPSREAK